MGGSCAFSAVLHSNRAAAHQVSESVGMMKYCMWATPQSHPFRNMARCTGVSLIPIPLSTLPPSPQGLGNLTDAMADCGRARALDPSFVRAHTRMAALLQV